MDCSLILFAHFRYEVKVPIPAPYPVEKHVHVPVYKGLCSNRYFQTVVLRHIHADRFDRICHVWHASELRTLLLALTLKQVNHLTSFIHVLIHFQTFHIQWKFQSIITCQSRLRSTFPIMWVSIFCILRTRRIVIIANSVFQVEKHIPYHAKEYIPVVQHDHHHEHHEESHHDGGYESYGEHHGY